MPRVFKGLKERPLKGPLRLYRGFMRPYKAYIMVILVLELGVPSRGPSYCPLTCIGLSKGSIWALLQEFYEAWDSLRSGTHRRSIMFGA